MNPFHEIVCKHPIQNVSSPHFNNTNSQYFSTDCKITDLDLFNHEVSSKVIPSVVGAKIKEKIKIDEQNQEHRSYRIFLSNQNEIIPFAKNVLMEY